MDQKIYIKREKFESKYKSNLKVIKVFPLISLKTFPNEKSTEFIANHVLNLITTPLYELT